MILEVGPYSLPQFQPPANLGGLPASWHLHLNKPMGCHEALYELGNTRFEDVKLWLTLPGVLVRVPGNAQWLRIASVCHCKETTIHDRPALSWGAWLTWVEDWESLLKTEPAK